MPRLEERYLAGEVDVLALEVGEGLGGGAVGILAHDSPLGSLAHRHGAVVVDAPERLGGRGRRRGRDSGAGRGRPRHGDPCRRGYGSGRRDLGGLVGRSFGGVSHG